LLSRTVKIVNKLGLHARPSAKIVQVTSKFDCEVYLKKDDLEINAKSIMGVMMLAAGRGSEVTIRVEGSDEEKAIEVIAELLSAPFEDEQ